MATSLQDFGARIRERRTIEGYTQEDLADELGISRTYLSQIEQGHAANLSLRLAQQISTLLGLEVPVVGAVDKIDPALRSFARKNDLPAADIEMLAGIEFRGKRPTEEQWRLLYNVIKATLGD